MKGLLGTKVGMTQLFDEEGRVTPVTVIEAGPCFVTQIKNKENDGYQSVQIGFHETQSKKLSGGEKGHLQRTSAPSLKHLREFRIKGDLDVAEGQELKADVFSVGEYVDVIGTSKGKGFQGGMKRHNFRGAQITHGQSDRQRAPGSIGSNSFPGRVIKGLRMAGHMGADRVTAQNLVVVKVDPERNIIAVRGSVPGANGSLVVIRQAKKK
jgi:large subunit ribosomal protein L3